MHQTVGFTKSSFFNYCVICVIRYLVIFFIAYENSSRYSSENIKLNTDLIELLQIIMYLVLS